MVYTMKRMPEMTMANSKAWVKLAVEFLRELEDAKGNHFKAYESYHKACSTGFNKAAKELGYSKKGTKAFGECWKTNTDVRDMSAVLKQAIKWGKGVLNDPSQLVSLVSAVLQIDAFKTLVETTLPAICASSA